MPALTFIILKDSFITDYILIKKEKLEGAQAVLIADGHHFSTTSGASTQ